MSLLAAVLGTAVGASTSLVAPTVVRCLQSADPDVQANYDRLGAAGLRRDTAVVASVLCTLLGLSLGWSVALPVWLYLGAAGALLAVVDARTRQLPAAIVNPCLLLVAATIASLTIVTSDWPGLTRAVAGWAAGGVLFGLMWLVAPASLGYGDARLAALLGMSLAWLSWTQLYLGLFLALLLASVVAVALLLQGKGRDHAIALGPFLIAGAALSACRPG